MAENKNRIARALLVLAIVDEHYEPGRQDRSKTWIWRNIVRKQHPMSRVTYFRLLTLAAKHKPVVKGRPKGSKNKPNTTQYE